MSSIRILIFMDVLLVNHRNYDLLTKQIKHLEQLKGDKRILICDNSPIKQVFPTSYKFYPLHCSGIDGETHGIALDYLVRKAKSQIVCIQDTDFFWTNPNIFLEIEEQFRESY